MVSRPTKALMLGTILFFVQNRSLSVAGELIYGCCSRPACGKVCKLICDTTTLSAACYACECEDICVPGPSRPGCKHRAACCQASTTADGENAGDCCGEGCASCREQGPQCEFCWRDWIACGCARPRTVKVLTKYAAEKEIRWYHWEVVDACESDCPQSSAHAPRAQGASPVCQCVYKPAPGDAKVGDSLPLSDEERSQVEALLLEATPVISAPALTNASLTRESAKGDRALVAEPVAVQASLWQRIGHLFSPGDSAH